jgi:hypothetical protein
MTREQRERVRGVKTDVASLRRKLDALHHELLETLTTVLRDLDASVIGLRDLASALAEIDTLRGKRGEP